MTVTYPLRFLPVALHAAGVEVVPTPGWATRIDENATPLARVLYVVMHADVSPADSGEAASVGWDTGDGAFPGPKYNVLIGRPVKGVSRAFLLGADRANHAGIGGPLPGVPADDLNVYSVGVSYANDNVSEAISAAQLATGRKVAAVLVKHFALQSTSVIFHRTWTDVTTRTRGRKTDPHTLDLGTEQRAVAALLKGTPTMSTPVMLSDLAAAEERILRYISACFYSLSHGTLPPPNQSQHNGTGMDQVFAAVQAARTEIAALTPPSVVHGLSPVSPSPVSPAEPVAATEVSPTPAG